jgi:hypothetical protein
MEGLAWWFVLGAMALSVAFALIEGGDLWAAPAIVVPAGVAFIVWQRRSATRRADGI